MSHVGRGDAGTLLGFTVDELDIPTTDGVIRVHNVPVTVLDVTVSDGKSTFTLDGDLGMNVLLPSMDVTAGTSTSSPFDFMTFDESRGLLILTDSTATPEPTAFAFCFIGFGMLTRRTRR